MKSERKTGTKAKGKIPDKTPKYLNVSLRIICILGIYAAKIGTLAQLSRRGGDTIVNF